MNVMCNIYHIKSLLNKKDQSIIIKNKEEIKQKARDKYNSLSPEEKRKRQEYRKEWFKNLLIEKKEQLR